MKEWNRTGKIKAVILGLLSIPNLVTPIPPNWTNFNFISILVPFIFGSIVIPIIIKFTSNFGSEIKMPTWNDNPLIFKKPLNFFHFGSFFMLAVGSSMTLATLIIFQGVNPIGLLAISYGLGILVGIKLTVRFFGKQEKM